MSPRARLTVMVTVPVLAAAAVATTAGVLTTTTRTAAPAASAGVDWSRPGPYAVTVDKALNHTIYRPAALQARSPVVIWGNGTGAAPSAYAGLLRHWAGYGFIVVAANTRWANDGVAMRKGLDLLAKRNAATAGPYYQKVDMGRVAPAGHSQGGAGALNAASDPRVDAVLPIQPGPLASPEKVNQPTLYMAGQNDTVVKPAWVLGFYGRSSARPAAYAELRGATHFTPAGNGGAFRGPTAAWLRFVLADDPEARGMFGGPTCGYCSDTGLFSAWRRNAKFISFTA